MKKVLATAVLLLVPPILGCAQEAGHYYRGQGYLFVAEETNLGPAGGGGGEVFLYKGFGMGGEFVKAASPFGEYLTSANMYYGVPSTKKNEVEPFVTGGLTFFSIPNTDEPTAVGWNVGGGVNGWLTKHAALRLEIRATIGGRSISTDYEPSGNFYTAPNNVVSFRIGVTFR